MFYSINRFIFALSSLLACSPILLPIDFSLNNPEHKNMVLGLINGCSGDDADRGIKDAFLNTHVYDLVFNAGNLGVVKHIGTIKKILTKRFNGHTKKYDSVVGEINAGNALYTNEYQLGDTPQVGALLIGSNDQFAIAQLRKFGKKYPPFDRHCPDVDFVEHEGEIKLRPPANSTTTRGLLKFYVTYDGELTDGLAFFKE